MHVRSKKFCETLCQLGTLSIVLWGLGPGFGKPGPELDSVAEWFWDYINRYPRVPLQVSLVFLRYGTRGDSRFGVSFGIAKNLEFPLVFPKYETNGGELRDMG